MQMCSPLGVLLYLPLAVLRIVSVACDLLSATFLPRNPVHIQLLETEFHFVDLFKEHLFQMMLLCYQTPNNVSESCVFHDLLVFFLCC